jgi:hypothetical protein
MRFHHNLPFVEQRVHEEADLISTTARMMHARGLSESEVLLPFLPPGVQYPSNADR